MSDDDDVGFALIEDPTRPLRSGDVVKHVPDGLMGVILLLLPVRRGEEDAEATRARKYGSTA